MEHWMVHVHLRRPLHPLSNGPILLTILKGPMSAVSASVCVHWDTRTAEEDVCCAQQHTVSFSKLQVASVLVGLVCLLRCTFNSSCLALLAAA
jgi:hypothetical protein